MCLVGRHTFVLWLVHRRVDQVPCNGLLPRHECFRRELGVSETLTFHCAAKAVHFDYWQLNALQRSTVHTVYEIFGGGRARVGVKQAGGGKRKDAERCYKGGALPLVKMSLMLLGFTWPVLSSIF